MPNTLASLSALVVDDERHFRRFVSELLRTHGITKTVEAKDGGEALELFAVVKPQLVVLDINMPRMDGVEVLRGIRSQAADVPVVMLTSVADEAVVERCLDEGATYFIRKDVPAQELAHEMRELLQEFFPRTPDPSP